MWLLNAFPIPILRWRIKQANKTKSRILEICGETHLRVQISIVSTTMTGK